METLDAATPRLYLNIYISINQPMIPVTLRCHLQVDVASHSPGGGPAVSHDPIGFGCGAVVTHRHDAMVLAQVATGEAGAQKLAGLIIIYSG